jgi:cell division protease FtsH
MSDSLGPVVYGRVQQLQYLNNAQTVEERNFSEATAQAIDTEVKALAEEGRERARDILTRCRSALDALTAELEERETLSGDDVNRLAGSCSGNNN